MKLTSKNVSVTIICREPHITLARLFTQRRRLIMKNISEEELPKGATPDDFSIVGHIRKNRS